jgi:hypothetical protein
MLRRVLLAVATAAWVCLSGCASIVNGHNQSVSVTTSNKGQEVAGAKCTLSNDKGTWYLSSPGSTSVQRSYGDLSVKCDMADLPSGVRVVKSSTTAAVFGNILVGGVIGAGIDVATGAAYNYPTLIPVAMGQTGTYSTPVAQSLPGQPTIEGNAALAALRVPFINDTQQAQYQTFLTKPSPRAFAIASNGHFGSAWGVHPQDKSAPTDPKDRALAACKRFAIQDCELYVVDEKLVYQGPVGSADSGGFDGNWKVSLFCPALSSASSYGFDFPAQVRNSRFRGEHGPAGSAGWMLLEGEIAADGVAMLNAKGLTGDARYSFDGAPPMSPYIYHVEARFDAMRGSGRRVEARTCDLTFVKL